MEKSILQYYARENCVVDTVNIVYPRFKLRSRQADDLARKYYNTTLSFFNIQESKKSRSKKQIPHTPELFCIKNFNLKEYEFFFKENNIKVVESFDDNVSNSDINNETYKYGITMPNTHYNSMVYDVIYDKMQAVYFMYEPWKIEYSFNGKWRNFLLKIPEIDWSDVVFRDTGAEYTSLKKLESAKFREDKVLWYKAENLLHSHF